MPTPPAPTEDARQAIWSQMQQEQRRPRTRQQRVAQQPFVQQQFAQQQWARGPQMPVPQQQQPARPANGVAAFVGCLIVVVFFVLVLLAVLGSIFSS
ncbi:hypothetical protein [Lentzea sp. NPDC059081]|uniref:hypothetical protein n=1 Tax=Lentzea sp. NPDC059081 TaxID=3346719 RepID=UPI00369C784F